MKTLLLSIILLFLSYVGVFAQSESILQFYDKYKQQENVTNVKMQGWVLKLASNFSDDEEGKKLLEKITQLRVLVMEEGNLVSPDEYKSLVKKVGKDKFELLMNLREGKEVIDIFIREDAESITDVLLLVSGDDQFVLLSLEGKFQLSDLNDLDFDVEGAEHLKKIPEPKKTPRA
ncbi:MAG TPA: DUF4252 domain-containing protein [Saprospiraceae bacterium]|nr:DUF4252 domain-containing protein [Saprospiraceae bacterium]HMQ85411.1 DUF4252 domain-containing protein [Saprospiraceae bacterium]